MGLAGNLCDLTVAPSQYENRVDSVIDVMKNLGSLKFTISIWACRGLQNPGVAFLYGAAWFTC